MRPRAAGPQLSHEGEGFKDINGQVFNVLCPRMTAPAAIPFQYQYPGTNWTARKSAKWRQLNILPSILGMPPDFRPEPTNPECPKSLRHGKFCRRLRNPAQSAFRFYGNNIPQDPTLSSKASAYIYIYLSLSLSLYPSLPLSLSLSLSLYNLCEKLIPPSEVPLFLQRFEPLAQATAEALPRTVRQGYLDRLSFNGGVSNPKP